MSERNGARGAPKGNRNARKHGFHAAKKALSEFGQAAIDGRSALGRALADFRGEVERDLGGAENLSAQQHAVIDVLCRTKLLLDGVDNFLLSQRSLINKRKRALLPIVRERTALAESYVRHLQMLGLEKRQPPAMDLQAYLRQRGAEKAESKLPTGGTLV